MDPGQAVEGEAARQSVGAGCLLWHHPSRGFMRCNVDAAVQHDAQGVGVGMILRDNEGSVFATTNPLSRLVSC